jgi:hypothetical protein
MTTKKTTTTARRSVKKRQSTLKTRAPRSRAKPGTQGTGEYYRIEVRPKTRFASFRTQDVGGPGHIQRLAGKRASGTWATQAWLISKEDAHISGTRLIGDTTDAKELLKKLGSTPEHLKGDVFQAKDQPDVPEVSKPTTAQQRAQTRNIRKAQTVRATGPHSAANRASSRRTSRAAKASSRTSRS